MNKIVTFLFALGLGVAVTAEIVRSEEPIKLPDSDTSSIGKEITVAESPFKVSCSPAKEFLFKFKKFAGKPAVYGSDYGDGSLLMLIKFVDGSILFARSDKDGKQMCIFGTVFTPDVDMKLLLQTGESKDG